MFVITSLGTDLDVVPISVLNKTEECLQNGICLLFVKIIEFILCKFSPIMNYGLVRAAGHMDFYPNGGDNLQPGCITYYNKGINTLQAVQ